MFKTIDNFEFTPGTPAAGNTLIWDSKAYPANTTVSDANGKQHTIRLDRYNGADGEFAKGTWAYVLLLDGKLVACDAPTTETFDAKSKSAVYRAKCGCACYWLKNVASRAAEALADEIVKAKNL